MLLLRIIPVALLFIGLLMPCHAQFTDDFTDGDYTSGPSWWGDTAKFEIHGGDTLRLNAPAVNDMAYLVTKSEAVKNASWEFYVKLDFNPSSSNYTKIYLIADEPELDQALNGYYVMIGNTADEVSLYRQTGSTETMIIDGTDNRVSMSPITLRVKVNRDSVGNWELFSDTLGGTNFYAEGAVVDTVHTTGYFFGVFCNYTSTRSDKFFFDDFDVTGTAYPDTTPPAIGNITVRSSDSLDIHFSEFVDLASAETATAYSVNNGLGNPVSAVRDTSDSSLVHLAFGSNFINNTVHQVTVTGITDIKGNTADTLKAPFVYFVPSPPGFKSIVLNEAFADPTPQVGLPAAEFVEIFNADTQVYDLRNWTLTDGNTTGILPSKLILPGEYIILCSKSDTALYNPFSKTFGLSSWPSLNNSGDMVLLQDSLNNTVDEINYDKTWYSDPAKEDGGWSLEQINPYHPCSGKNNWMASTDPSGGTPGMANAVLDTSPDTVAPEVTSATILSTTEISVSFSEIMDSSSIASATYFVNNNITVAGIQPGNDLKSATLSLSPDLDTGVVYTVTVSGLADCAGNPAEPDTTADFVIGFPPLEGDIIINEILADPTPQVGLPAFEFAEIYNVSNKIIDLSSCTFSGASFLNGTFIFPGDHLILCALSDTLFYTSYGKVAGMNGWSSTFLVNSGKLLQLKNGTGNIVDEVTYTDEWYKDPSKDNGGWSLELINPYHPCSEGDNWRASENTDGGTPGAVNSVFDTLPDTTIPFVERIEALSTTTIEVFFNEAMDSASISDTAIYKVHDDSEFLTLADAKPKSPFFKSVVIEIAESLDSASVYHLDIFSDATDCSGNNLYLTSFPFGIGVTPEKFDVLITEIIPNPDGSQTTLPEAEYVELFNASDKLINLEGCKFRDGSSSNLINPGLLFPGEYAILCDDSNEELFNSYGKVITVGTFPSLNNSGEPIGVENTFGKAVHEVNYSKGWYGDEDKSSGGWSLEMIDMDNPCSGADNWKGSVDPSGGTPGKENSISGSNPDDRGPSLKKAYAVDSIAIIVEFNEIINTEDIRPSFFIMDKGIFVDSVSVIGFHSLLLLLNEPIEPRIIYTVTATDITDCIGNEIGAFNIAEFGLPEHGEKGDIVINEILFNPVGKGADFVEVYNRSEKFVSLQNWEIGNWDAYNDTINRSNVMATYPMILYPGNYLVFTDDIGNIAKEYPQSHTDRLVELSSLPSFPNNEGVAILINSRHENIDRLDYNETMHFSLLSDVEGISLERIDFNSPAHEPYNWHSAAEDAGFATPGYQNSQYMASEETEEVLSMAPEIFSPDNDGNNDVLKILYKMDQPGYVGNILIFDAKGRKVINLVQNKLLSIDGFFTWDGITQSGTKARTGIYIIWFEAFHKDGKVIRERKSCVLATRLD